MKDVYAELPVGLFLLRGDNVVIFGEYDEDLHEKNSIPLKKVSLEELKRRQEKKLGEAQASQSNNLEWDLE